MMFAPGFGTKYYQGWSLSELLMSISLLPWCICRRVFRFVKNLGKDTTLCPNGMDVAKLTQKKVLQILENGVRFGKWVLLENIGEVRKAVVMTDSER